MLRLAWRELVSRRVATGLAALGLLTATVGFILLASTSKTTEAVLTGEIGRAWSSPYDLLVRPPGTTTQLEQQDNLVRPNYLSGIVGGITLDQLQEIRHTPGVQVAAPIAVVGFTLWPSYLSIRLDHALGPGPITVFRMASSYTAQDGLSHYPGEQGLLVAAPGGEVDLSQSSRSPEPSCILRVAGRTLDCASLNARLFAGKWVCTGDVQCPTQGNPLGPGLPAGVPGMSTSLEQPLLVAGIDPVAEGELAGLDRCITSGRYLTAQDQPHSEPAPGDTGAHGGIDFAIPLLASNRSFLDESVTVNVERATDSTALLQGKSLGDLHQWTPAVQQIGNADQLYRQSLGSGFIGFSLFPNLWSPGDVHYQVGSSGRLVAVTQNQDFSVFENGLGGSQGNPELLAPPAARDTWFRNLTPHKQATSFQAGDGPPAPNIVGRYDPNCLPGFNPLSGGRLETYAPPQVKLPNEHLLGPTDNMAGYVNSPPLLLTNLAGAAFLDDPSRASSAPGKKFLSAIRVRVGGTETAGPISEARLARVAAEIHDRTTLQVDVVKGSSPKSVQVDLPAGKFGRPALTVTEAWSVKGVAFRFLKAVSGQNLALFVLVLASAIVLVSQTGFTSVRRRRSEFGTLKAMGWPTWRLAQLVVLEMVILGLLTGVVALLVGLGSARLLNLGTAGWQLVGAVPLAILIAALAAGVPALSATRGSAATVMRSSRKVRPSRLPESPLILGIRDLATAWRTEAILGVVAVTLGALLLGGVVVIASGFRGQLDATVLGTYLSGEVRPFHVILAALALALGALAAGQLITLSYLERQPQLATLRALGWPRRHIVGLVAGQALALGLLGGFIAAILILAGGAAVRASIASAALGAAIGMLAPLVTVGLAVIGPCLQAYRLSAADALRGE